MGRADNRTPSLSQSQMDRFLGVLVIVCASAVIVALSAHAGPPLSAIFRAGSDAFGDSTSSRDARKRRRRRKARRGGGSHTTRPLRAAEGTESDSDSDGSSDSSAEDGDAYHVYAHGARSVDGGRSGSSGEGRGVVSERGARDRRPGERDGGNSRLVLHVGSCHCGGLVFEVDAPEHLVAIEGPSKVRAVCGVYYEAVHLDATLRALLSTVLLGMVPMFAAALPLSVVGVGLQCKLPIRPPPPPPPLPSDLHLLLEVEP